MDRGSAGRLKRLDDVLYRVLLGVAAAYLVLVLAQVSGALAWVRDQVAGNAVYALAGAVLAVRWRRDRDQRYWLGPLVVSQVLNVLANVYYYAMAATVGIGFPSLADAGWVLSYVFLALAVLLPLRRHRVSRLTTRVDLLVGVLAAASVTVLELDPIVTGIGGELGSLVSLIYPLADVLLVSVAVAALGLFGLRSGPLFTHLLVGISVYLVADVIYAHQLASGSYAEGGWLDGLWALGWLVIVAGARRHAPPSGLPPAGAYSPAVLGLGVLAATSVLVVAAVTERAALAVVLAVATLLACAARVLLAFQDARRAGTLLVQAHTDELTGVANRRGLYGTLDEWLAQRRPLGLVLVDLDRFKEVNDTYGHNAGDQLLRAVARRLQVALDHLPQPTPHVLSRLGGDEFAAVLAPPAGTRPVDGEQVMALMQDALSEPVDIGDTSLHVQASMGFARAPVHADERSSLLFCADAAMYAAKSHGDPWRTYTPQTAGDRRERLQLAEDLYRALDEDELATVYQPVVSASGQLVGAEALVRWRHPTRGVLAPAAFLEIAERHRLSQRLTGRVLGLALADLARWRAAGHRLRMSVNVSASELRDERLVSLVADALLRYDVPAPALTVEITETALMRERDRARAVLAGLRDLGVQVAIDDYGTGYSGLQYLLDLNVQLLKIDRSFVAGVAEDERARRIVASTLQLATALGVHPVAEGVETPAVRDALVAMGCPFLQGWATGRPVGAEEFWRLYLAPAVEDDPAGLA